jgi:accessory gene regulator protein AgrB
MGKIVQILFFVLVGFIFIYIDRNISYPLDRFLHVIVYLFVILFVLYTSRKKQTCKCQENKENIIEK